jgi:[NiFe] hydrogenase diaphorase moiety large subunit
MTIAALAIGARQGLVYLRGEYRFLLEPLQRHAAAPARCPHLLGAVHPGPCRLRLRHRDPRRRRRLRVRRGVVADRVARRQARHAAHPPALPGRARVPRPADHGRTTSRPSAPPRTSRCRAAPGGRHRHAASPPAPRSIRCRATASARACTSTRSARASAASSKTAARATRRRCRSAGRRACACRPSSSAGASPSRTCPRPAPSWCSTAARDMFEVARNFAHFFAHESCGFCTPCRVGTALVVKRMDKLARRPRLAPRHRRAVRARQADAHRHPLRPGGRPAIRCATPSLKFRPAYERHLKSLYFEPAFDLDAELSIARR